MKAAIYIGKHDIKMTNTPTPECGENDVLLKTVYASICVYPYQRTVKGDSQRAGTVDGFAEYIHATNAKLNDGIYIIPDEISDKMAALIEPFAVGTRQE